MGIENGYSHLRLSQDDVCLNIDDDDNYFEDYSQFKDEDSTLINNNNNLSQSLLIHAQTQKVIDDLCRLSKEVARQSLANGGGGGGGHQKICNQQNFMNEGKLVIRCNSDLIQSF